MITPEEIQKKAERIYMNRFLAAHLKGENFFPLKIPGDKGKSTDPYAEDAALIRSRIPELEEWLIANPKPVIANAGRWDGLLKVCRYFMEHPRPGLYIRELPVEVHTKFIEENKGILSNLRGWFPQVKSLLMDRETFCAFKGFAVSAKESAIPKAPNLTAEEKAMFQRLVDHPEKNRLEQERIPQAVVAAELKKRAAGGDGPDCIGFRNIK